MVDVLLQVLTRIRGFAAMNRLKKEALKVIAGNLPMDEIVGLKEMFHAMDKDDRSARMSAWLWLFHLDVVVPVRAGSCSCSMVLASACPLYRLGHWPPLLA